MKFLFKFLFFLNFIKLFYSKSHFLNKSRQLGKNSNFIINFKSCNNDNQCNHGICENGYCKCDKKYVTYIDLKEIEEENLKNDEDQIELNSDIEVCNYKLKSQLTALMLSIFIGFGSEHFYMGNKGVGAGKFVFYIFCYFLNIGLLLFYVLFKHKRNLLKFIGLFEGIYMALGFLFMFFWNLRDWIKIGLNQIPDSKGFKLYSWNDDENPN